LIITEIELQKKHQNECDLKFQTVNWVTVFYNHINTQIAATDLIQAKA